MVYLWGRGMHFIGVAAGIFLRRQIVLCLIVIGAAAGVAEGSGATEAVVRVIVKGSLIALVLLFMLWLLDRFRKTMNGEKPSLSWLRF